MPSFDLSRSPLLTTVHDVLGELRDAAWDERDKGDRFERLIASYLRTDPLYAQKYDEVWRWSDWPGREARPDTGIDLVARERETGELCAIQCKFYDASRTLEKGEIDSFFTASGKEDFSSRMIVSTTDRWSKNAEDALERQQIPVSRIRVQDLDESGVDWSQFSLAKPEQMERKARKSLFPHQELALQKVVSGLEVADRGKLIMACGTGKTFTSLRIAEHLVPRGGSVLFLVPSISLLSQALKEWAVDALVPLRTYAVCSDVRVGKRTKSEDIGSYDLAFPATTHAVKLHEQMSAKKDTDAITVVFSTYQSIQAISEAQRLGMAPFDLVICDEAHRTTGVTLADDDESAFVRVHDDTFLKARKRLYMTATPRIYDDASKGQAQEHDPVLCSMDDESIFGAELHRLGFGEAVGANLLTDYKVLVLAVDETYVSKVFQNQLADRNHELQLDDAAKIVGCWNGLSKRGMSQETFAFDTAPMRRAVAFARSIKDSQRVARMFNQIVDDYTVASGSDSLLQCEVDHVDGTFNALQRNEKLDWLKAPTEGNLCRILSNARCLSEGVDVPALDAVMFLNPRNSVVDVVQSVGRVMRRSPGKEYGYVILPIGVPSDQTPEEALKDNQKYKVVWQVLQALRAHDDRFNAMINKIELNRAKDDQLQVIGVPGIDPESERFGDALPTQGMFSFLRSRNGAMPSTPRLSRKSATAATGRRGRRTFPRLLSATRRASRRSSKAGIRTSGKCSPRSWTASAGT
jgi:predicted helicase